MSDKLEQLVASLAAEAKEACVAGVAAEEDGRELTEDEVGTVDRASYLAVKWTSTQPVSAFVEEEGDRDELAGLTKRQRRKAKKKARKAKRRKFDAQVDECEAYIKAHWDDDGPGFIIALFTAVLWHLIVVLIVRWIILRYFDEPELPQMICQPDSPE